MTKSKTKNGTINKEDEEALMTFILGTPYAEGTTRKVFQLRGGDFSFSIGSTLIKDWNTETVVDTKNLYNQHKVVKVACKYEAGRLKGIADNIKEWDIWCQVRHHPELSKWFCPVTEISDCGRFLVMLKCDPVTEEEVPSDIPEFLSDVKAANWGKLTYEGITKVVMLDYAGIKSNYILEDYDTTSLGCTLLKDAGG